MSPHLTIYKPQISSVLSILHRISGVTNFLGMVAFLWWIVFLTFSAEYSTTTSIIGFCSCTLGRVVLVAWTFGLFLHVCTGIRHLFWDAGYGFEKCTMAITGWLSIGFALIITALVWALFFNMTGGM